MAIYTEKKATGVTSLISNLSLNSNMNIPEHIDRKHWNEWLDSGIHPTIIEKNIKSIYDSSEADKLINRNNRRRWKHSDNLIPCWAVTGIDPSTDEPTLMGCQLKPDTPIINKNGKIQKYIGASEYDSAPLFLKTEVNNYWASIITDKSQSPIITEGAKKAAAGLSIGYPVISIPGVSTCRKNGKLHDYLSLFTGFGRTFYLCFDNDILYKRPVQNAMLGLARELSASGSKVMVVELPPGECKGMDDFISHFGKEAFDKLVEQAATIEEWRKKIEEQWQQQQIADAEENPSKLARRFELVKQGWGENIALNTLKNSIELAGQPLDIDQIRLYMSLEFKEDIPVGDARMIIQFLAEKNAYSPVLQYLDSLADEYPDVDLSILENLSSRYFGTTDPMYDRYLKMQLIASVARVRKPGTQHDCACIIVGKQGSRKSTFWQTLYGNDWFSDELGDANEKDELAKLHRFWCLEWAEFETVYKRKDIGALKKFMTSKTDTYRTPYSIHPKDYPRSSVLVGTTNESEILNDPTGSRRFWVIPSQVEKIPVDMLRKERDLLWAAANAAYLAGEKWYFTKAEDEERQAELNQQYEIKDPWTEKVRKYIQFRDYVTIEEVLIHLEVETARQTTADARRLSTVLRKLDWKRVKKRVDELNLWVWVPESNISNSPEDNVYSEKLHTDTECTEKKNSLVKTRGTHGTVDEKCKFDTSTTENKDFEPKNQNLVVEHRGTAESVDITTLPPSEDQNVPHVPRVLTKLNSFSEHTDTSEYTAEPIFTPCIKKSKFDSPVGEIKAIATQIDADNWEFLLQFPDGTETHQTKSFGAKQNEGIESAEIPEDTTVKAVKHMKKLVSNYINRLRFVVTHPLGVGKEAVVEGCKFLNKISGFRGSQWSFMSPDGKTINIFHASDFRVE